MIELLYAAVFLLLLWGGTRYCVLCPAVSYRHPRILMYHMIAEHKTGARFNGLRVSPRLFEEQLRYLKQNGWQSMTMGELSENQHGVPDKTVVLTFDDGYQDNYTHAFPLLKQYGFKATVYLVVDRHDRDWSVKRKQKNDSGELMREPKLSDEQVAEMVKSGVIEVGSHTMTHPNFSSLDADQTREELDHSKASIEQLFGVPCRSFCYPFGIYKTADPKLVEAAGYQNATTTALGISRIDQDESFTLRRITVSGKDNMLAFKIKLRRGRRGFRR